MTFKIIDPRTEAQIRWQSSPLFRAIDTVIRSHENFRAKGVQVGNNRATRRIVGASEELAILYQEIMDGSRDGLGYPVTEEGK